MPCKSKFTAWASVLGHQDAANILAQVFFAKQMYLIQDENCNLTNRHVLNHLDPLVLLFFFKSAEESLRSLQTVEHLGQAPWEPTLRAVYVLANMELSNVSTECQGRLETLQESIYLSIDSDTCIRIQRATLDLISWPAARFVSKLDVSRCQPEQSMPLCVWTYQLCLLLVKYMLSSL